MLVKDRIKQESVLLLPEANAQTFVLASQASRLSSIAPQAVFDFEDDVQLKDAEPD